MCEVPRTGQVERDTGVLSCRDDLVVADGSARLHDGFDAGTDQNLQSSGKGKKASEEATDPSTRSPARCTAK